MRCSCGRAMTCGCGWRREVEYCRRGVLSAARCIVLLRPDTSATGTRVVPIGVDPDHALILSVYRCRGPARLKRSRFITLVHAATNSSTNFSLESVQA